MVSFFVCENMLALAHGLRECRDLILLSEVNFVDRLVTFALEGVLEGGDLVVLLHSIPWHGVYVQIGAQLVVSVHVNFLLQLSAHVLVSIVSSEVLVKFSVLRLVFGRDSSSFLLFLLFHGLSGLLISLVLFVFLLSLLVEFDDQLMLLGSCQ